MQIAQSTHEPESPMPPGAGWRTDSWGLHPLTCAFLVTVDLLLAGNELATGVPVVILTLLLSLLVAITLIVPCAVMQKYTFGDPWGVALAKGVMGGLLTGIPTPFPSVVTIALGVMGALALHRRRRAQQPDVIDAHN